MNTFSPTLIYLCVEGVTQTTLDIATFDWEEAKSGWKSLMRKHFPRFLPNMSDCEITKCHAYQEIQEWFEVAYLGWQFHTSESKPHVESLTSKVISMLYSYGLLILSKESFKFEYELHFGSGTDNNYIRLDSAFA